MSSVRRVYVEKKPEFAMRAKELKEEIHSYLGIQGVTGVRVLIRYDVENLEEPIYRKALGVVFHEPPVDDYYEETFDYGDGRVFSVEYLPGQFDQRSDSAVQCIRFLKEDAEPVIRTAVTYVIEGDITEEQFETIKGFCINPVDSRETGLKKPETLMTEYQVPEDVAVFDGFAGLPEAELKALYDSLNLAMTFRDFQHIQNYYRDEEYRDPSMTEIRVLDTYWSDHCRHTTFSTELKEVTFGEGDYREPIEKSYRSYLAVREELFAGRKDKFVCLMDLALIAMRKLKKDGRLQDMEESDEINACSIVVPVTIDGEEQEWLISFKNETHNHPTEIEPFGGAATCLGGAIRDPLSGRSYVYQAMRVTGAANPTLSLKKTLTGKLPQKKLVRGAASGYSSYGNQIGLATGYVKEIYHPDYVAKRLEIGAVIGAAPRKNVIRETSDPGDVIILLGGRTGRDGCGGATGSSKVHTETSIETCGAEVQKGNAPTERKIQRLFRREEVSRLIKKCNDFGAGGVSVAIGELADGLTIWLDKVPKKYAGLDGTELAISESQERMAVVVDPKDVPAFLAYASEENLEAVEVAVVTEEPRLVMIWRDKEIVNISRAFLNTNGAHQETSVFVDIPSKRDQFFCTPTVRDVEDVWLIYMQDLNVCSQKGLVEMFDSSIGAGSVLMPYGGKYQLTETQAMVAKLPVLKGECDTVTMMSYGFDPVLSSWSPYHGAIYAVLESVSRIVAAGGDYKKVRFTFQEYFRRMSEDPARWSQPFAALLGAYEAQMQLGLPSIGGKDSMSGTFNDIDVPPTLVSFAVDVAKMGDVITPEMKHRDDQLLWYRIERNEYDLPKFKQAMKLYDGLHELMQKGAVQAAYVVDGKGAAVALSKMAFGNRKGFTLEDSVDPGTLFAPGNGDIIVEVSPEHVAEAPKGYILLGKVTDDGYFICKNMKLSVDDAIRAWKQPLEKVFPSSAGAEAKAVERGTYTAKQIYTCRNKVAKPTVFIPVFPGTNCEYDSTKVFEKAGARVRTQVFRNLNSNDILESVEEFEKQIEQAQIIMFPGGFSAGDEPDGSAKFFATAFQNEKIREAVHRLLDQRDGLALGICNGFQALIKLGLVPYGKIVGQTKESPTLTYNTINRHISKMAYLKVTSNKSPWLQKAVVGGVYANPASHGEGRFVANDDVIAKLFENGQVATQYCDLNGAVTMDDEWNINGSYCAIEGITSPDGRCLGKMAHSERQGRGVAVNIYGEQDLGIFESGVAYFQ